MRLSHQFFMALRNALDDVNLVARTNVERPTEKGAFSNIRRQCIHIDKLAAQPSAPFWDDVERLIPFFEHGDYFLHGSRKISDKLELIDIFHRMGWVWVTEEKIDLAIQFRKFEKGK